MNPLQEFGVATPGYSCSNPQEAVPTGNGHWNVSMFTCGKALGNTA